MTLPAPLAGDFLAEAAANVEYSLDHRALASSVTVPLAARARQQVVRAGAALPLGGAWARQVERLIDAILPNALLLRFDSERAQLVALTAYLRFPRDPDAAALGHLLAASSRLAVQPAVLAGLMAALGCAGPRGLGVRGGADGTLRLALYFKVERDLSGFGAGSVGRLLAACGWDGAQAGAIEADLRLVHPGGGVGVIGVDLDAAGAVAALKCDPANVPLARAQAFLHSKLAAGERIAAMHALCRALRAQSLSYLGVKYTAAGFAGWRLYFSCRPAGPAGWGRAALLVDTPGSASLRLPHY